MGVCGEQQFLFNMAEGICLWWLAQPVCNPLCRQIAKRFVQLKALVVVVLRDFPPQQLTQKDNQTRPNT